MLLVLNQNLKCGMSCDILIPEIERQYMDHHHKDMMMYCKRFFSQKMEEKTSIALYDGGILDMYKIKLLYSYGPKFEFKQKKLLLDPERFRKYCEWDKERLLELDKKEKVQDMALISYLTEELYALVGAYHDMTEAVINLDGPYGCLNMIDRIIKEKEIFFEARPRFGGHKPDIMCVSLDGPITLEYV